MMLGAVLASATNLLFILLLQNSDSIFYLYLAVTMDNLASGLAGAVRDMRQLILESARQ